MCKWNFRLNHHGRFLTSRLMTDDDKRLNISDNKIIPFYLNFENALFGFELYCDV